eukprot:TRINITY_DN82772_c0_g1_i1.p1 TRINITY_DN82772_c0_g1~~TRINITY_DN82772_c0_g1_i1.p1  ORF type:complete len:131 (-),score=19.92 TRINITY_DN82772_c0_g1_i1:202-594(-)
MGSSCSATSGSSSTRPHPVLTTTETSSLRYFSTDDDLRRVMKVKQSPHAKREYTPKYSSSTPPPSPAVLVSRSFRSGLPVTPSHRQRRRHHTGVRFETSSARGPSKSQDIGDVGEVDDISSMLEAELAKL